MIISLGILCFSPIQDRPIQDRRGGEDSYQFFSCKFSGSIISLQYFLTFSFNIFATLVLNVKFIPSPTPKLLNLKQESSSKKFLFLLRSL